ncbi:MAG: response regulator transcription factor [Bacteroidales bacterium]|jgi:DNA-binding NarL/FixJ family response regulator|nr:response regulator transcription factor [Bacteroidales bacterium]
MNQQILQEIPNTKIIIVDDHELFLLGLRTAITNRHPDIEIVGEAQSGTVFFSLLKTTTADLVLLDIMLPDMSGIEIARRLKIEYPKIKILAISAEKSAATIEEMLKIGIEGFISKLNSNPDILAVAVNTIMQGGEYFGSDISEIIHRIYIAKKKTTEVTSEFSHKERQIIECCHEGMSSKQIADKLFISVRTVDWHKYNIFRKLGINSSLEMVRYAMKNGIL